MSLYNSPKKYMEEAKKLGRAVEQKFIEAGWEVYTFESKEYAEMFKPVKEAYTETERMLRPYMKSPIDSSMGKGIKYVDEVIIRKAGKAGKK